MEQLLNAINVWLTKPQVSSTKIFASKIISGDYRDDNFSRKIIFKDNSISPLTEEIVKKQFSVIFTSELGSYEIKYDNGEVLVSHESFRKHPIINEEFFENILNVKLNCWIHQEISTKSSSLSLVDVEYYQSNYIMLKQKYGPELVKNWEEKTDPEKFVYEDIAIASYLISLWKNESKNVIKFVDAGCGNGLLVYLLIMEGYQGIGLDIRSRNIWSKYPENVQKCLSVCAVNPSTRYPGYNWWIGNHSDELTPWIPVLAAKSALSKARVFLLPCCPFDFFGKFSNDSLVGTDIANESRYKMYQSFIENAMKICGFSVETDYLRIPSTKRFSLVGTSRYDSDVEFEQLVLPSIEEFIKSRPGNTEFRPRDAEIPNKNCSSVDHSVRDLICNTIFLKLLSVPNVVTTPSGVQWNKGGRFAINELIGLFSQQILNQLKSEHGGLQTMLKNHHQAFKVVGGFVEIRYEDNCSKTTRKRKWTNSTVNLRTKNCWYYLNHPDGCPYPDDKCNFIHVINGNKKI